jgi:hypothetical protein
MVLGPVPRGRGKGEVVRVRGVELVASAGGLEYAAFAVNIVLLMGRGLSTARAAGRGWGSALVIAAGDALVGVLVVVANAVVK